MIDKLNANDANEASVIRQSGNHEKAKAKGVFVVECYDKNGKLKWKDTIQNLVTTVGKNSALDIYLAGSSYTATDYMGLISSDSYTGVNVADTMGSHGGWNECSSSYAPDYSGDRKTCVWSAAAAGSKALSAALEFTMSESGTVKGCFIVYYTGASATKLDTGGTLYSCGLFTGGDKTVVATDVLKVSYTASL